MNERTELTLTGSLVLVDEQLLEAIAAAPDDPAPRLVYADHCSHTGGDEAARAHGELIVVQHQLAEIETAGTWSRMFSREAERLRIRERVLIDTLLARLDVPKGMVTFAFGFVDQVDMNAATPANLTKRAIHPIFRAVRALAFETPDIDLRALLKAVPGFVRNVHRLEGFFAIDQLASHLSVRAIDEVAVPIIPARAMLRPFTSLKRLVFAESSYLPTDEQVREMSWNVRSARDEIASAAEEQAGAEHTALAKLFESWDVALPMVENLVLETLGPITPSVIVAVFSSSPRSQQLLRHLRSLTLHCGEESVAKALVESAPAHLRHHPALKLVPESLVISAEAAAWQHAAIGRTYLAAGRTSEARVHLENAFAFSAGHQPSITRFVGSTAARATTTDSLIHEDEASHRIPALVNWARVAMEDARSPQYRKTAIDHAGLAPRELATQLIDRVLAAAPEHAGAWAMRGIMLREDYDIEGAATAFAHALRADDLEALASDDDQEINNLAHAYATAEEDSEGALEAIRACKAPSLQRSILTSMIHTHRGEIDLALQALTPAHETHPIARVARGLIERAHGRATPGRLMWVALASETKTASSSLESSSAKPAADQAIAFLTGFFAAILAAAEPYPLRRAFHMWFAGRKIRPMSMLVFDPLIATCARLMPNVDILMVVREIERLRGALD